MVRAIGDQEELLIFILKHLEVHPQIWVRPNVLLDILRQHFVHYRMTALHGVLDKKQRRLMYTHQHYLGIFCVKSLMQKKPWSDLSYLIILFI